MRYERCGFVDCRQLIEQPANGRKKYCNKACKQSAYRRRKTSKEIYAKVVLTRYCVNCGKQFTTSIVRQQFHNTSCRVSFWQQQKRLKEMEE